MKDKRTSILLSGYYGYRNVGDDLLLQTLVFYLKEKFYVTNIRATINEPSSISKELLDQINCIQKPKFSRFKILRIFQIIINEIHELKQNDILIYGGGTRFFETSNRTYQTFLIKYLVLQYNSLFLKRTIIHLGIGVGKINSRKSRWFFKRILSLSDHILLRDQRSYNKVLKLIDSPKKVSLGYDLMFLKQNLFIKPLVSESHKIKIGLNFFEYYGYISNDITQSENFKKSVLKICSDLLSHPEIEIHLFSFQKDKGGKDEKFHEEIHLHLKNSRVFHVKYSTETQAIINKINQMDFCAGMRYHFCLLSLYKNKPTIGINYQPKVRFEYEDLNLEMYCVEIKEIEKITNIIFNLIKESDSSQVNFSNAFKKLNIRSEITKQRVSTILKPHLESLKTI